jgi:hypothetical protein
VTDVPYNHCAYLGSLNCPDVVNQGKNVSRCARSHHRIVP